MFTFVVTDTFIKQIFTIIDTVFVSFFEIGEIIIMLGEEIDEWRSIGESAQVVESIFVGVISDERFGKFDVVFDVGVCFLDVFEVVTSVLSDPDIDWWGVWASAPVTGCGALVASNTTRLGNEFQ